MGFNASWGLKVPIKITAICSQLLCIYKLFFPHIFIMPEALNIEM